MKLRPLVKGELIEAGDIIDSHGISEHLSEVSGAWVGQAYVDVIKVVRPTGFELSNKNKDKAIKEIAAKLIKQKKFSDMLIRQVEKLLKHVLDNRKSFSNYSFEAMTNFLEGIPRKPLD